MTEILDLLGAIEDDCVRRGEMEDKVIIEQARDLIATLETLNTGAKARIAELEAEINADKGRIFELGVELGAMEDERDAALLRLGEIRELAERWAQPQFDEAIQSRGRRLLAVLDRAVEGRVPDGGDWPNEESEAPYRAAADARAVEEQAPVYGFPAESEIEKQRRKRSFFPEYNGETMPAAPAVEKRGLDLGGEPMSDIEMRRIRDSF